jgi:mRNA interferase MazF
LDEEAYPQYPQGSVVLVPFPFTDLSGRKRRPALVVSPANFHDADLILCAITSQLPHKLSEWEATLDAEDMVEEKLPKQSIVKPGKLFTMHRELSAGRYGVVKEHKLQEILGRLQNLFEHPADRRFT